MPGPWNAPENAGDGRDGDPSDDADDREPWQWAEARFEEARSHD